MSRWLVRRKAKGGEVELKDGEVGVKNWGDGGFFTEETTRVWVPPSRSFSKCTRMMPGCEDESATAAMNEHVGTDESSRRREMCAVEPWASHPLMQNTGLRALELVEGVMVICISLAVAGACTRWQLPVKHPLGVTLNLHRDRSKVLIDHSIDRFNRHQIWQQRAPGGANLVEKILAEGTACMKVDGGPIGSLHGGMVWPVAWAMGCK